MPHSLAPFLRLALTIACGFAWIQPVRADESPSRDVLRQAYDDSRAAKTIDDLTAVIALCQEGLDAAADESSRTYARQLLSWCHNKRGERRVEQGEEEAGLADFEKAIELNPQSYRAINNRAVSRATLGETPDAFADFDRVIQLKPDFAAAWFNRATLRVQSADWRGAVQDYSQAHKLKPADAAVLVGRAQAYRGQGSLDSALVDLNQALRTDSRCIDAIVERADIQMQLGRYAESAADARSAIRLDPKSAPALRAAAWLMATCPDERFRDRKLAVEAAQKAADLAGDDYRYLDTLAAAFASAEQYDRAIVTQKKAVELLGNDRSNSVQAVRRRLQLYEQHVPYRESFEARRGTPSGRTSR